MHTELERIATFESGQVRPECFHHADHVRLAFAYLSEYEPLEAIGRFCRALQAFAAAAGKADRYHETITWALLFLIRERMARLDPGAGWDEFAAANADLLLWKPSVLDRYYCPETLASELARRVYVLPDRGSARVGPAV